MNPHHCTRGACHFRWKFHNCPRKSKNHCIYNKKAEGVKNDLFKDEGRMMLCNKGELVKQLKYIVNEYDKFEYDM